MKTLTIGRDSTNDIVINDNFISRKHAQLILLDNKQVILKDLDSSNGSFVNGNKIKETNLNPGDIVKFGSIFFDWQAHLQSSSQQSNNTPPVNQERASQQKSAPIPDNASNKLFVNSSIADNLPAMVKNELATLSAQKQQEFVEEYNRKKKSVALAYLLLFPFCLCLHYGYLRKWGLQLIFWFTFLGFGIWWFIDLFRTYGMVQDYNKDVAIEVIRNLKAISNS